MFGANVRDIGVNPYRNTYTSFVQNKNSGKVSEKFSEKIDITDSFLGQIERGERALSVKTLKKVVKYTGVSADYLLFGKDSKNNTIEKINNILTINSNNITSDFIYHVVMCSNDFCKKLSDENKN